MGFSVRRLVACAAAAGLVQLASANLCNQNNCYRAIKADSFSTRHGLADCNSYLLTTIILPTR